MSALALKATRLAFFNLPSFQAPVAFGRTTLLATVLGAGSLRSFLEDLFPPFLLAVPKKKVSHSRKAMRSSNKGLKDKQNLVHCPGCGLPKVAHHLCATCYGSVTRLWKSKDKVNGGSLPDLS
ncbi:hypothetical protein EYR36_007365 [Pleurotus pulmonarius]|nr:hypothetical protein EYR36_007365 [Pleurotus pulmonarius]